jgi:hypothetical protein
MWIAVTKLVLHLLLASFWLASCALSTDRHAANARREPEIFRVGEIEVRLYQDRESMVRDLPPFFALLEATRVNNQQIKVNGFYDPEHKRIYSIDDAKVVIHEFKHYLEPAWRHGAETARSEASALKSSPQQNERGVLIDSVLINRLSAREINAGD